MTTLADDCREALVRRRRAARRYRPRKVDLLVVAEAPPDALDRYFYFEDVRIHDGLFRYVYRAVVEAEPRREKKREQLRELQARGVFLLDLNEDPCDSEPLSKHVPGLVERCRELDPGWIVLVKRDTYETALEPLRMAGLPVSDVRIPFPGSGQQNRFLEAFARAVRERTPSA